MTFKWFGFNFKKKTNQNTVQNIMLAYERHFTTNKSNGNINFNPNSKKQTFVSTAPLSIYKPSCGKHGIRT